jgi:hypothetical protein
LGDVSTSSEHHDPAADVRVWASTVIAAIRAIRGETSPEAITGAEAIENVIRSARSLAIASGAVIDAMLIAARAGEPRQATGGRGGRPSEGALTLRELGDILGRTHGAVDQRIRRITAADYVAPPEDHWLRD